MIYQNFVPSIEFPCIVQVIYQNGDICFRRTKDIARAQELYGGKIVAIFKPKNIPTQITSSPSNRLDVSGNFRTSGLLQTNDRLYIASDVAISSWISSSLTAGYSVTNSYGWLNSANNLVFGTDGSD